jgi:hypothetical protein
MVNEITKLLDAKLCLDTDNKDLQSGFENLISMSLASGTWAKYNSGWRSLLSFEDYLGKKLSWPIDIVNVRSYVVWCITVKKLASSTVKTYLSALAIAHTLKGYSVQCFSSDKIVSMLLTGADNAKNLYTPTSSVRRAMTLSTLKIIGHKIAKSQYSVFDKQMLWCVCTTAFFTSVRLGEILSAKVNSLDIHSTLLWKHVKFLSDCEILLYVPSTKTSRCKGEFIDMFSFHQKEVCPISSMKRLLNLASLIQSFSLENPVFMFESGKMLTTAKLNEILKNLLSDIFVPGENAITCHSFRQAIPSVLNSHPSIFTQSEIKCWGRWVSDSYLVYLKLQRDRRRTLFQKIANVL